MRFLVLKQLSHLEGLELVDRLDVLEKCCNRMQLRVLFLIILQKNDLACYLFVVFKSLFYRGYLLLFPFNHLSLMKRTSLPHNRIGDFPFQAASKKCNECQHPLNIPTRKLLSLSSSFDQLARNSLFKIMK
jgi:hypothetical protein